MEKNKRKKDGQKSNGNDDEEVEDDKENDDADMELDNEPPPATPKRRYVYSTDISINMFDLRHIYFFLSRRESSSNDGTQTSTAGSAIKRQRRPARQLAAATAAVAEDHSTSSASQIHISASRLDAFKTHLSALIDRQPSVTTQEIFNYMNQQDSTFNEDEIRMALAKMQDENQIMLAGEIVIRI